MLQPIRQGKFRAVADIRGPRKEKELVRNVKLPPDAPLAHCSTDRLSPYVVEIRSNIDEPHIRAAWLEFESSATAFQRLSFVEGLYRRASTRGTREPVIVTVRERRSGVIVLIAALSRRRRFGLTIIEAADCSLCDYFVPLTSPGRLFSADEVRSIWAEICRALQPADAIIIKKIPDDDIRQPQYRDAVSRVEADGVFGSSDQARCPCLRFSRLEKACRVQGRRKKAAPVAAARIRQA